MGRSHEILPPPPPPPGLTLSPQIQGELSKTVSLLSTLNLLFSQSLHCESTKGATPSQPLYVDHYLIVLLQHSLTPTLSLQSVMLPLSHP